MRSGNEIYCLITKEIMGSRNEMYCLIRKEMVLIFGAVTF